MIRHCIELSLQDHLYRVEMLRETARRMRQGNTTYTDKGVDDPETNETDSAEIESSIVHQKRKLRLSDDCILLMFPYQPPFEVVYLQSSDL